MDIKFYKPVMNLKSHEQKKPGTTETGYFESPKHLRYTGFTPPP